MACVTGASDREAGQEPVRHETDTDRTAGEETAIATAEEAQGTAAAAPDADGHGIIGHPLGSRLDDLWQRLTGRLGTRQTELLLLLGVTLFAGVVRFWQLAHPGTIIFDETYYLKDSWSLVQQGYESKWPEGANPNEEWAAGNPDGYLKDPAFVVHPPLGKLIMGLGMMLFGADNPFGWRVSVAALGTLSVTALWLTARKMFGSPALATIGAFLMAIDGHAIVTSRISILDGILAFFIIVGVLFTLYDREQQRAQMRTHITAWKAQQKPDEYGMLPKYTFGPIMWRRPWLVGAAIAFGCASAVKWSGLYFLAVFCVYALVVDAIERHRHGVTAGLWATVFRQGPITFLLTVPAAFAVYLASWTSWLSTTGGYFRTWAEQPGNAWSGLLSWVPLPVQSLWHYSVEAYKFHTSLDASHPYQAPPTSWPFLIRPTAFSYVYSAAGDGSGCETGKCVEAVTSLANPIVWWSGTIAILFLLIIVWVRPKWQYSVIFAGYGAAYLPWLFQARQAVFQFYGIVMLPFMILALLALLELALGTRHAPRKKRTNAIWLITGLCGIALAVSVWFYPVWTGMLISQDYWATTQWLPGWR